MALSSNWFLRGPDGVKKSCASLGIENISIELASLAVGTASFQIAMARATDDPLFGYDNAVQILNGDTIIFAGKIRDDAEAEITGNAESQAYVIRDAWYDLEHVIFQQSWTILGGETETRSRVILGQAVTGLNIKSGEQITEILNYAIGAGAALQIGSIPVGDFTPTREELDYMCAECIKVMLRWTPDAVGWFDYTTTPPTLHIKRRANLTPVTLPMVSDIAETLKVKARRDIQVPSVTLKYETVVNDDGGSYTATTVDRYPANSNPQAINAIVQTIELSGLQITRQKQSVVTGHLRSYSGGDSADATIKWWQDRVGNSTLRGISRSKLELVTGSEAIWIDPAQVKADGVTPIVSPSWSDRELVNGTITEWMETAYPSLKTAKAQVWIDLSYVLPLEGTEAEQAKITQLFNIGNADENLDNILHLQASPTITNAVTQTYSIVTGITGGETAPTGLAESLFTALNTLHYEGSFTTADVEISQAVGIGNVFNISGGRNEWATMNAVVQRISHTLATGQTTVEFGPPEHLSPQDIVEFIQGIRNSQPSFRLAERSTGAASSSATVASAVGWTSSNAASIQSGGGGSSVAAVITPWQIITQAGTTSSSAICNPYSYLFSADFDFSQLAVANLGNSFSPGVGNYAFLKLTQDSTVKITKQEFIIGGLPDNPITVDDSGSPAYISEFYLLLAKFVDPDDNTPGTIISTGPNSSPSKVKVAQLCNQHQLVSLRVVDGLAFWATEPWTGIA